MYSADLLFGRRFGVMFKRRGPRALDTLTLNENGFIAEDASGNERYSVKWTAIARVIAFKRDMLTTDLICFRITYSGEDGATRQLEINEEMPGFEEIVKGLDQLQGFNTGWRTKVVQPAFVANEVLIFEGPNRSR